MRRWLQSWAVIIAVTAVVSSVITIAATGPNRTSFGDAADYSHSARGLLRGSYPRESPYFPVFRPPLYPLFISGVWRVTGEDNYFAIKIMQACLFTLTAVVLYAIGLQIFGDKRSAGVGGVFYAVYPLAVIQTADLQTEVLHTLLVAGGVLALLRSVRDDRLSRVPLVAAGVLFGVAGLCRPSAVPIGGLLIAAVPLACAGTAPLRRRVVAACMAVAACGAAIAPWTYLNWRATNEFILVSDALGFQLWLGNHPAQTAAYERTFGSPQEFDAYVNDYLQGVLVQERIREWERDGGYRSLTLKQRERLWRDEAIHNLARSVPESARCWLIKGLNYWRPWLLPAAYPRSYVILSGVGMVGLYLAAFAGAVRLRKRLPAAAPVRGSTALRVLILLFVTSTLVHMVFNSMIRFRLPYVDPYLCLLAGFATSGVLDRLAARRT